MYTKVYLSSNHDFYLHFTINNDNDLFIHLTQHNLYFIDVAQLKVKNLNYYLLDD